MKSLRTYALVISHLAGFPFHFHYTLAQPFNGGVHNFCVRHLSRKCQTSERRTQLNSRLLIDMKHAVCVMCTICHSSDNTHRHKNGQDLSYVLCYTHTPTNNSTPLQIRTRASTVERYFAPQRIIFQMCARTLMFIVTNTGYVHGRRCGGACREGHTELVSILKTTLNRKHTHKHIRLIARSFD